MVLISIRDCNYSEICTLLKSADAAEIRLDLCELSESEIRLLFAGDNILIATCRPSERVSHSDVMSKLIAASEGMALSASGDKKYIDLDIETSAEDIKIIKGLLNKSGSGLILSLHNYNETPCNSILEETVAFMLGEARFAKVATMANSTYDAARVINLYRHFPPDRLIAFCMGSAGRFTRRLSVELGSPFTYASVSESSTTAPGQFTVDELNQILNPSNFPFKIDIKGVKREVDAPASKSFVQRAIVAASLAKGATTLTNYTSCNDTEAACNLFRSIGVSITEDSENRLLIIESPGALELREGLRNSREVDISLFTGESGLLTRLVIPIFAALSAGTGKSVTVTGHGTIMNREFAEPSEVLPQLGFEVYAAGNRLPLKFGYSGVVGADDESAQRTVTISGREGSQLISGLLMALPLLKGHFGLKIDKIKSTPYIDTTISILEHFGIKIDNYGYSSYHIAPNQKYSPAGELSCEGDWSSAAPLLVAGALNGGVKVSNLSMNSGQADEKIIEALKLSGAKILFNDEQMEVSVEGSPGKLSQFSIDATDSPDLFPSLAVLAAGCRGVSRIKGVERLFNKESNRAEALFSELTKLGININIEDNIMVIEGISGDSFNALHSTLSPVTTLSYHDHRIAMALALATILTKKEILIDDIDCLSKSFPGFLSSFTNR